MVHHEPCRELLTLRIFNSRKSTRIGGSSGCVQAILYALIDSEVSKDVCTIGITDPSAQKCIDKDILSFSIQCQIYQELEEKVEESLLTKETCDFHIV